ncbi:MAG: thymidylate kinase [Candidatus Woesearchaeota archaeon]
MKGKLIVIDGLDGSGKYTQFKLLSKRLEEEGYSASTFDFPQYDKPFGAMVGRYLKGEFGDIDQVEIEVATMLYALDRYSVKQEIKKELVDGKIVVLNRYTPSNLGFQGAKFRGKERQKFLKWIDAMESRLPQPDLIIFLDVPRKFTRLLMGNKDLREYLDGKKEDIHEKNDPYQLEVEGLYRKLSEERKNWRRVDCVSADSLLSIDEVHNKVWEVVEQHLNNHGE